MDAPGSRSSPTTTHSRDTGRQDVHKREYNTPDTHAHNSTGFDKHIKNSERCCDQPAPVGEVRRVIPLKVTSSSKQEHATSRMGTFDCEGDRVNKHGRRHTERWVMGVIVAGMIVSGLILIIVLYTILTISSFSPVNSNSSHQSTVTVEVDSSNHSKTLVENEGNLGDILDSSSYDDPDLQDYQSYVADYVRGAMKTTVAPCDDFYEYACGNWGVQHPPPGNVSYWSTVEAMTIQIWHILETEINKFINTLHDNNDSGKLNLDPSSGTPVRSPLHDADSLIRDLVVNYYEACNNESHLTQLGVSPLQDILHKMDKKYRSVAQLPPLQAFQRMLEHVHYDLGIHAFFSWKVEVDTSTANLVVIELISPNTDMPLQGTKVEGNAISIYKSYASDILAMIGTYDNKTIMSEVNTILHFLQIYQTVSGSLLVNVTNTEELKKLAPFLDWHIYFNKGLNRVGVFLDSDERILSMIQDYLSLISKEIMEEISSMGTDRLYVYLRWQVIHYYSQYLHKPVRNMIQPLFDEITGENTTGFVNFRLRQCTKELAEKLIIPSSYLFLETMKTKIHKSQTVKGMIRKVEQMTKNIRNEYINYINSFKWPESSAKNLLIDKLRRVNILVGYPPVLDDVIELHKIFESLNIKKGSLLENQIQLLTFEQDRKMRFLKEPGKYTEWEIVTPLSVISFYVYRMNSVVVPLGGLTYPLYSSYLPEFLAYATMGVFISHELGHAVDLMGRTRDSYGRVNTTLWSDSMVQVFIDKVVCRISEYSKTYYPINNILTIAEVMADGGSVINAFRAIKSRFRHAEFPPQIRDLMTELHLTPDQFFFLSYAQLFCMTSAPGVPLKGVKHYPPHSTRVRATLTNTPDFHTAFECPKNTKMNPIKESCDIW
ncbi:neprilysin-3-like [Homarus americanus]|uniref:Neprilysin-3-like 1 n=1 Tax=Homarus americanus TaxID=6706 RepID=A0A8J5JQK8_HOMAM|nr:neprilysin-3-like [Homarus americanus]KAG7160526.1 Neprilysin-3-like 1 [Homarus americanus]